MIVFVQYKVIKTIEKEVEMSKEECDSLFTGGDAFGLLEGKIESEDKDYIPESLELWY